MVFCFLDSDQICFCLAFWCLNARVHTYGGYSCFLVLVTASSHLVNTAKQWHTGFYFSTCSLCLCPFGFPCLIRSHPCSMRLSQSLGFRTPGGGGGGILLFKQMQRLSYLRPPPGLHTAGTTRRISTLRPPMRIMGARMYNQVTYYYIKVPGCQGGGPPLTTETSSSKNFWSNSFHRHSYRSRKIKIKISSLH